MRVLLMVERGGRVKCVGRGEYATMSERVQYDCTEATVADRWWLVEAESAEAARTLIYLRQTLDAARRYVGSGDPATATVSGMVPEGRILASGRTE